MLSIEIFYFTPTSGQLNIILYICFTLAPLSFLSSSLLPSQVGTNNIRHLSLFSCLTKKLQINFSVQLSFFSPSNHRSRGICQIVLTCIINSGPSISRSQSSLITVAFIFFLSVELEVLHMLPKRHGY